MKILGYALLAVVTLLGALAWLASLADDPKERDDFPHDA